MVLSCHGISKSFGTDEILNDVSFHINDNEKAAIVGINGAGKSTLLKIIVGEMSADKGEVIFAKGSSYGYLSQHQDLTSHNSIYDELLTAKEDLIKLEQRIRALEAEMKHVEGEKLEQLLSTYTRLNHEFELQNGYAYRSEVTGVLKGLGFDESEFSKIVDNLSGGQKTRIALGKLLLTKPDLIILDEPTNHLDLNSVAWLETYLLNYNGAVLIVAHDRYFLDKTVTKIIEIENTKGRMYDGNYSAFAEKKAQIREIELKHYLNQQQEIKHQEEVIEKLRSFNREKSIKRAESRVKALDKIERLEKPVELNDKMKIVLEPNTVSGNDVLTVTGLSKSFGSNHLFSNLNFEIKRGERVAILGNNGTGKTTLLKIITGGLEADSGKIVAGTKVEMGYYDQEHQVLHPDKTIFEEISDAYPTLTITKIRNLLAAFLFTGDDVFKLIRDISGGERGRVSLAKLMLSEANLLILDEPTNHLDITSKEILEDALNSYTGTLIYVSHDRYFIDKTATRILDLTGKQLINYNGNYSYYLEKKDLMESLAFGTSVNNAQSAPAGGSAIPGTASAASTVSASSAGKADWQQQKDEQARIRKLQNDLKKTENEIEKLEQENALLDEQLIDENNFSNHQKLVEIQKRKDEIEERLTVLMEQWENLSGMLEQ